MVVEPKYLYYGNLIIYVLYFILIIVFTKYVYDLDYSVKYATYMENECDGTVIEKYTMRYITNNEIIQNRKFKSIKVFIYLFSFILILLFIGISFLEYIGQSNLEFIPINIIFGSYLSGCISYSNISTKYIYQTHKIDFYKSTNNNDIYNSKDDITGILDSFDYDMWFKVTEINFSNSIFKEKVNNDLELNANTHLSKYLKILLKRIARYENFSSINDSILYYNECIDKKNYNNLIEYIDFKNDRDKLILAISSLNENNIFILNQFNKESDLNNADINLKDYLLIYLNKLNDDMGLQEYNSIDNKLTILNNHIENGEYNYLINVIVDGFNNEITRDKLIKLKWQYIYVLSRYADYNTGNILYDSQVDRYYTGNNDYLLANSKFEVNILNMKFFVVFLIATIGYIFIRFSIYSEILTPRLFIIAFFIVFAILLFVGSILLSIQ